MSPIETKDWKDTGKSDVGHCEEWKRSEQGVRSWVWLCDLGKVAVPLCALRGLTSQLQVQLGLSHCHLHLRRLTLLSFVSLRDPFWGDAANSFCIVSHDSPEPLPGALLWTLAFLRMRWVGGAQGRRRGWVPRVGGCFGHCLAV